MDTRDYAAEMRTVIDEATSHGPYIPRQVAGEVVEKLAVNDPQLLDGWLREQAEHFVWQAINDRDRSRRSMQARSKGRAEFGAAAEHYAESGDDTVLRKFLDAPYSVEGGLRKPLADLTRDDLLFVEADYRRRSAENLMRASFMAALAKKVRKGVVGDYFTESQVAAMFESLTG